MTSLVSARAIGKRGADLLGRLGDFSEAALSFKWVFSLAGFGAIAALILTIPVGLGALAWQAYVWAATGSWPDVPIAAAFLYFGFDLSAVYSPANWKGLAAVAQWLLGLPLASVALLLPGCFLLLFLFLLICAAVAFVIFGRSAFEPSLPSSVNISTYERRAASGDPVYQNDFGYMLEHGFKVAQDYVRAHMWYNLAAATHTDEKLREGSARNRDRLAKRMTPEQIAEAQELAREWLERPRETRG